MACSRQHLCQQGEINLAVGVIELAGGANQQLSGGARLNVKCHRGAACMGAGTVSQLYQLVAEQGAVTVGDRQLAFFALSQCSSNSVLAPRPLAMTMARARSRLPLRRVT